MFNGQLSDKTGTINLVYFGQDNEPKVKAVWEELITQKIVMVNGTVSSYKGDKQINIDGKIDTNYIRPATPEEIDTSKFIPDSNQDGKILWNYIHELIASIENPHLKQLMEKIEADKPLIDLFKTAPGAKLYHHACKGGLLEHVWETTQYCEIVIDIHPSLDRDLVLCGAILHDIGKIRENEVSLNIAETPEGMLLGHINIGTEIVKEKISEIPDFPKRLEQKLVHILLSHHGKTENGAGIEPKTPEAATVYTADLMGSLVSQYIRARKDSNPKDFRTYREPIGWVFRE
ncbi:MAG: HD domain-containing protein [Candidatus Bathyarchaeota archaeon]|nr:HD domain-containing protein [Candidatus Bathyarchaeota archaeon]